MKFKDYINENIIKKDGITWELKQDVRWGGLVTHIIYKNGKEFGQLPPNLDKKIAEKTFKNDVKTGKILKYSYSK